MVMSNRGMACRNSATPQQRRFLGAHPRAEKTNHDTPPSLTQFGKPCNFKEAKVRLSRIACRQGQSFLAIRSLLYLGCIYVTQLFMSSKFPSKTLLYTMPAQAKKSFLNPSHEICRLGFPSSRYLQHRGKRTKRITLVYPCLALSKHASVSMNKVVS